MGISIIVVKIIIMIIIIIIIINTKIGSLGQNMFKFLGRTPDKR